VTQRKDVLIVGGGASGVLMACHLLKEPSAPLRVTLIERRADVGLGIAYGTANRNHLLNVRASNMSAFPDDPDHFWRWLVKSGAWKERPCPDPFCFVPRPVYGKYIAHLIGTHLNERPQRLRILQGECVAITETASGVEISLADGARVHGEVAVLATGNEVPPVQQSDIYVSPWSAACEEDIGRDDTVLILGTGLTMVDHVLTLIHAGHCGRIVAMSRRGLLPQAHRRVDPWPIRPHEIPFGRDISVLLHWIRGQVRACEARGGNWRSVVDGLRPYIQNLWQRLPQHSRARFLEHGRAWWDVHRHRMAPEVEDRIAALMTAGRLRVVAGKVETVEPLADGAQVRFRRRGAANSEVLDVNRIIECRGVDHNPKRTRNPVLRNLLDQGLARPDPLNVGLEVSETCALLNAIGRPSRRLYAIGPLTRSAFWEIMAVPDIRTQCADLASRIIGDAAADPAPASRLSLAMGLPGDRTRHAAASPRNWRGPIIGMRD
jgi:uncharacterized NAD(P)/FAD-binding protein YdhS